MNQRWTLHVENFARIESADIEISPLLCFIGDNNSGKSYIMTLLWGLIANGQFILQDIFRENVESETYIYCNEWFSKSIGKTVEMTNEVQQMYIAWLNEVLARCKDELVRKIFNHDIRIGKIEIRNFSISEKLYIHFLKKAPKIIFPEEKKNVRFGIVPDIGDFSGINFNLCWDLLMRDLIQPTKALFGESTPLYLPSSRTGFLLARREIANKAIEKMFSLPTPEVKFQEKFTEPYIHFLKILNNLHDSTQNENYAKLVEFFNDEIFHGTLKVKEDGKIIRYIPEDLNQEIPLSITSSVVTETSTLLLLLTNQFPDSLIIVEEPEAHLHPALQKKMAQLLIRLVHNGFPIWITTHSDTMLQHFNNMIKLNNRSADEREALLKEFNYNDDDLLTPEEINLYQFERGEKTTAIKKLTSGKYGFVANLFNKAIDELVNEIYAFQEVE